MEGRGPEREAAFFFVHPAVRLVAWLALVVAVQRLAGWPLLAAGFILPLAGARALRHGLRLAWRTRWLLLSLFLVFAWGTPGEALWNAGFAPTREGVAEAATHFARLLLVLFVVAALLENLPPGELFAAARALLAPLRRLGIDADRGLLRLMLALRYFEALPRPRDWKALLEIPETAPGETIEIDDRPLRRLDAGLMAAMLIALAAFCCLR
jgi:energy-coupling factor transporter transmembrane protein EcfT